MPFVSLPGGKSAAAAAIWQGQGGPARFDPDPEKMARAHIPCFLLLSSHTGCDYIFFLFQFTVLHHLLPPHPPSLSHSFGKNSSWIVFLEEETNVRVTRLVQVLAKFDRNKVRRKFSRRPPSVRPSSARSAPPLHAQLIKPSSSVGLRRLSRFNLLVVWFQSVWQVQRKGLVRPPVKLFFLLISQRGRDCSLKIIH